MTCNNCIHYSACLWNDEYSVGATAQKSTDLDDIF